MPNRPTFGIAIHQPGSGRPTGGWHVTADMVTLRRMIDEFRSAGETVHVAFSDVPYAMFVEYGYHTSRGNWVPGRPAGTMASMRLGQRFREATLRHTRHGRLSARAIQQVTREVAEGVAADWRQNIRAMNIIDTGAYLQSIQVASQREWQREKNLGRKVRGKIAVTRREYEYHVRGSRSTATQQRRAALLTNLLRSGSRGTGRRWQRSTIRYHNRQTVRARSQYR